MNVVPEQDLELLEEYLDEALTPGEIGRLEVRLAAESSLAGILDELRAQREARAACFASFEPSETACAQFAARVSKAAHKQSTWSQVNRYTRYAGAAAACILLGFFAGWMGREKGGTGGIPTNELAGQTVAFVDGPTVSAPQRVPSSPGVLISEITVFDSARRPAQVLMVSRVEPGSPSGLREGDVILTVNGQNVRDLKAFANVLSQSARGTYRLRIIRDQRVLDLEGTVQP